MITDFRVPVIAAITPALHPWELPETAAYGSNELEVYRGQLRILGDIYDSIEADIFEAQKARIAWAQSRFRDEYDTLEEFFYEYNTYNKLSNNDYTAEATRRRHYIQQWEDFHDYLVSDPDGQKQLRAYEKEDKRLKEIHDADDKEKAAFRRSQDNLTQLRLEHLHPLRYVALTHKRYYDIQNSEAVKADKDAWKSQHAEMHAAMQQFYSKFMALIKFYHKHPAAFDAAMIEDDNGDRPDDDVELPQLSDEEPPADQEF